jgi:hypothetical protein
MTRIVVAVAAMLAVLFLLGRSALPQVNPNCTEFGVNIPGNCCCTNNCCTEAAAGEFRHLRNDLYQSTVTGQAIHRTGWSHDGRTIKCACDQDYVTGQWVKSPKANVRCLFIPMPSS